MQADKAITAAVALIFVLALIGLVSYALRWLENGRMPSKKAKTKDGKTVARIEVLESKMLDTKRRLILVRVDEKEIALLLSPNGEQVVYPAQSAIKKPVQRRKKDA